MKSENILLYKCETIRRSLPENLSVEDMRLFYPEDFLYTIPNITIDKFSNVRVLNHFFFKDNKIIDGYVSREDPGFKQRFVHFIKLNSFSSVSIKEAFCGINQWGNNYFHWITEVLPYLNAFLRLKPKIPIVLPTSYQDIPFIIESIKKLAIEPFWLKSGTVLKADIMYAAKLPKVGQYSPALLKSLVNEIVTYENNPPLKMIYISRMKAKRRKISNESEFIRYIKMYNFETVFFEDLSWNEQISLMRETKVLISCHGAGLTNCIFMPPGGSVIELRGENNNYNCFYTLSDIYGLKYFYQCCKQLGENHREDDIYVNIKKLDQLLKNIFIE